MKLIISILILFFVYGGQGQDGVARFDTGGVIGTIHFTLLQNGSVSIRTMFSNLPFTFPLPYHVHEFPVDYRLGPAQRCGLTGGHHDPTGRLAAFGSQYGQYCNQNNRSACEEGDLSGKFGRLTNGTFTYIDNDISTNGRYGILYRSVVIHRVEAASTPRYVCATIEPTTSLSNSITAVAALYGRAVSGDIYFFQQQGTSTSTQIYLNLNTVGSERSLTGLSWNIKASPPGFGARAGDCSRVGGGDFNPSGRSTASCNPSMASTCPEFALTEKHGYLNISESGDRYFFTEVGGITLYQSNSIIGRSLTILMGSQVVACAAMELVSPIVLQGSLQSGFAITASQYFPFSAARVSTGGNRTGVSMLNLQETGYISNAVCLSTNTVYNPFSRIAAPAGAQVTRDVGLGNLLNQIPDSNSETVMTSTLPLSGPYSAAERTIYYVNGGTPGCVNFRYYLADRQDNAYVLRAYATFSGVANCMVHFTQLVSRTSYLPTTPGAAASNPNFISGDVLITDNCTNAMTRDYRFVEYSGSFYNPYMIQNQANNAQYSSQCVRGSQRRCTVGNNLAQITNNTMRSTVDTNLELAGAYGIASDGIRAQVLGQYIGTVQASGQVSNSYSVQSCDQFGSRLSNAIEGCSGVGANNFLNVNCTGNDPTTVYVNTVFDSSLSANQMQNLQDCIDRCLNAGNRIVVPLMSLFFVAILSVLLI